MDYKDYYKILEIDKKATPAEVKKAYRTLAKKNHPDKNLGDKKAEERFKLVNEANEVLGNEEKRKQYDDLGENWQQNQQSHNQQYNPNQQSQRGSQNFEGTNQGDFSDFFEQFFAQQRGGNQQQNQARRGGDYETEKIKVQKAVITQIAAICLLKFEYPITQNLLEKEMICISIPTLIFLTLF